MRVQLALTVVNTDFWQADRCSQTDRSTWRNSLIKQVWVGENREDLSGTRLENRHSAAWKPTGFAGSPHGGRSRKVLWQARTAVMWTVVPIHLTQHGSAVPRLPTCPIYRRRRGVGPDCGCGTPGAG